MVVFVPWSNLANPPPDPPTLPVPCCESGAGRPLFVRAFARVEAVRRREVWEAEAFALGFLIRVVVE